MKTEDLEFVHENKNPWCITEEERDFGLLTRRGQNEFTIAQKMGFREECAGSNQGKENGAARENHAMESICVKVDHPDGGGRKRGGDGDDDGVGRGTNATTSMVGAVVRPIFFFLFPLLITFPMNDTSSSSSSPPPN